jgi:putative SOS response-associated peptidase YedK
LPEAGHLATLDVHGDGPGKTGLIVIWKDGAAAQVEYRWGLRPSEPGGRPYTLIRAEGRTIDRPCLLIANEFVVQTDADAGAGKRRHRVSLVTDRPFFCIAGLWRPAAQDWPAAYAALTVEASPDVAPFKDRHMAVVRPEDWEDWLRGARPAEEILRPFPPGSFRIAGPRTRGQGSLFAF